VTSSVLAGGRLAVGLLAGPLQPDRDTARRLAEQELLGPEYRKNRPGLISQVLDWIGDHLSGLRAPQVPDVRLGLALVVVALVAVVAYAVWRSGGLGRRVRAEHVTLLGDRERTAAEHRAAAEAAERSGDLVTALVERFRALVRALADRDLVQLAPGLTADEAAAQAAAALPALRDDLRAAARSFDDVRYGDRAPDRHQVQAVRALDERAAAAKPLVPAR